MYQYMYEKEFRGNRFNNVDPYVVALGHYVTGKYNKICSFCLIEEETSIGNDNHFSSRCTIEKGASIGNGNYFSSRCTIGEGLTIGDNTFWGPGVTIIKGTEVIDFRKNKPKGRRINPKIALKDTNNIMLLLITSKCNFDDSSIILYPSEIILINKTDANMRNFKDVGVLVRNDP